MKAKRNMSLNFYKIKLLNFERTTKNTKISTVNKQNVYKALWSLWMKPESEEVFKAKKNTLF